MSELLQQKLRQAELLLAKREALGQKRQEALAEQGNLEPKLDRLLDTTRELQRLVRDRGGLPPPRLCPPPSPSLCPADRGRHLQALRRAAGEPDGGLPVNPRGPGPPPPRGPGPPPPFVPSQLPVATGWALLNKAEAPSLCLSLCAPGVVSEGGVRGERSPQPAPGCPQSPGPVLGGLLLGSGPLPAPPTLTPSP